MKTLAMIKISLMMEIKRMAITTSRKHVRTTHKKFLFRTREIQAVRDGVVVTFARLEAGANRALAQVSCSNSRHAFTHGSPGIRFKIEARIPEYCSVFDIHIL